MPVGFQHWYHVLPKELSCKPGDLCLFAESLGKDLFKSQQGPEEAAREPRCRRRDSALLLPGDGAHQQTVSSLCPRV